MHLNCMVSMYIGVGSGGGIEAMPSDFIKCGQMICGPNRVIDLSRVATD